MDFIYLAILMNGREQELKEECLMRTGHLIIRYAPCAKEKDAQWAYVGRYLFYCLSETKLWQRSAVLLLGYIRT